MGQLSTSYTVLNPTTESSDSETLSTLAPRLTNLNDKVLAFINNGKMNSDRFLQHILHFIKNDYSLRDVIWIDKTNASLPITDSIIDKLKGANAVISGIGD